MNTHELMRHEILDNLRLEGAMEVPSSERVTTALNRAKNQCVRELDTVFPAWFIVRKIYSVAAGDTSITLPDGTGGDPAVRRIVGLTRTSPEPTTRCVIVDQAQNEYYDFDNSSLSSPLTPTLYREQNTLYFCDTRGAQTAMTLLLRYTPYVPDLALSSALSATYSYIPAEWCDLIVNLATANLLSAASGTRGKYIDNYKAGIIALQETASMTNANDAPRVLFDPEM